MAMHGATRSCAVAFEALRGDDEEHAECAQLHARDQHVYFARDWIRGVQIGQIHHRSFDAGDAPRFNEQHIIHRLAVGHHQQV